MVYDSKACYVFNKFYSAFIKAIKASNQDLKQTIKQHYKVIDKSSEQYYNAFWESVAPHWRTFVDSDKFYEINELSSVTLATEMSVKQIFESVKDEDKDSLTNYVRLSLH